jgi:hypothetical protein
MAIQLLSFYTNFLHILQQNALEMNRCMYLFIHPSFLKICLELGFATIKTRREGGKNKNKGAPELSARPNILRLLHHHQVLRQIENIAARHQQGVVSTTHAFSEGVYILYMYIPVYMPPVREIYRQCQLKNKI